MAKKTNISAEFARQLLDYNPQTGILTWKARTPAMFKPSPCRGMRKPRTAEWACNRWNACYAGKTAGTLNRKGYIVVLIKKIAYQSHRIIWLIVTGEWPEDDIDHRDGIKSNNRWENLRKATNAENKQNSEKYRSNKSGFLGVHLHGNRWKAQIIVNYKMVHLGFFDTPEEASAAYKKGKQKFHRFQPIPRE